MREDGETAGEVEVEEEEEEEEEEDEEEKEDADLEEGVGVSCLVSLARTPARPGGWARRHVDPFLHCASK